MQWPLRNERATDMRVYRDPATGEPTLRCEGELDLAVLNVHLSLSSRISREAALRLRDQIDAVFGAAPSPA